MKAKDKALMLLIRHAWLEKSVELHFSWQINAQFCVGMYFIYLSCGCRDTKRHILNNGRIPALIYITPLTDMDLFST